MRPPRLFVDCELAPGREITLPDETTRHVRTVLRLRPGAPLRLFNGRGGEYRAELGGSRVLVGDYLPTERESALAVQLVQGVSRGSRMDYTLQKAVELGVEAITPVLCRRSTVRLHGDRARTRLMHWRGVVINACEQCGRTRLPALDPPLDYAAWLDGPGQGGGVVLDPHGEATLGAMPPPDGVLRVLAGPEGGLDDQELAQARASGYTAVRLGPRILRTETAAVAALAAIQALWGDLA